MWTGVHTHTRAHTHTHTKERRNNLELLAKRLSVDSDQSVGFQECIEKSKILDCPIFYLDESFLKLF